MERSPRPPGYGSVTPYLICRHATDAIAYYVRAFGAVETMRLTAPDGTIGHAELKIGDAMLMLADEMMEMGFVGPESLGGTSVSLMLYVDDADRVFETAISAGGHVLRPVTDQFYGDRTGTLQDPFGHWWTIATHRETVPRDEIERRYREMFPTD